MLKEIMKHFLTRPQKMARMARRLSNATLQIMVGNDVVSHSISSSLRLLFGMGLRIGEHVVPDKPLPVNYDLVWDNGASYPQPCIDRIADTVRKQSGRVKEEEFMKKVQEMMMEEEKLRIPITQGLLWITDELEVTLVEPINDGLLNSMLNSIALNRVLRGEIRAFLEEKEALKNSIMIVSMCKSKHVRMYRNKSITNANVI